MKLSQLQQIVEYMQPLRKINAAYRIADNLIKIAFDRDTDLYFDMRRGNSKIFMCDTMQRSKVYQAPFDVKLARFFNRATILDVTLLDGDKVIRISASQSGAYKSSVAILQLEFTGKYTNAIILDEEDVVQEALRHIDAESSFRTVRVGQPLEPLPAPAYTPKFYPIDNIPAFLHHVYETDMAERLHSLKDQKKRLLQKKLEKVQSAIDRLEDETALEETIRQSQGFGNLILANMHRIKPFMQSVEVTDFEGDPVTIPIPPNLPSIAAISDHYFKTAKKAKQKIAHQHIERKNLQEKREHLLHFIDIVEQAKDIASITMLFPAQQKGKKSKEHQSIETFWIEGYKVMLGKNEKGNIELLEQARARDIWLHLKDRPSTHVIIVTDKQQVPQGVIEAAARLCVDFSLFEKGRYLVDYTPRREVKIQEGAHVLYNRYETIQVEKS